MSDRTYIHLPGRYGSELAWHAVAGTRGDATETYCGRLIGVTGDAIPAVADRVPRDGHLCGTCSRVIAAETDVEIVAVPV